MYRLRKFLGEKEKYQIFSLDHFSFSIRTYTISYKIIQNVFFCLKVWDTWELIRMSYITSGRIIKYFVDLFLVTSFLINVFSPQKISEKVNFITTFSIKIYLWYFEKKSFIISKLRKSGKYICIIYNLSCNKQFY